MDEIIKTIFKYFTKHYISKDQTPAIIAMMAADKKNENRQINFSLLKKIGECVIDINCTESEIEDAISFYNGL